MRVADAWIEVGIANASSSGLMVRMTKAPPVGSEVELRRRGLTIKGLIVWATATRCGIRSHHSIDLKALFARSGLGSVGRMVEHVSATQDDDRRIIARTGVHAGVQVRVNGRLISVELLDVSGLGCQFSFLPGAVDHGDRIAIRFLQQISVHGKVVWLNDNRVGVEFDNPLHDAVVAHLGFRPSFSSESMELKDVFGRVIKS